MTISNTKDRSALFSLMETGLAAADPMLKVPKVLPTPPAGRTVVIGAGKAAAKMARATELNWGGELSGAVITRYGHGIPCERISVIEAGHPVPDTDGLIGTRDMLNQLSNLDVDDLVLFLCSGGGSSLFEVPAEGLSFADIRSINKQMLLAGMPISEMNCIRKHVSRVKGGRLAEAALPARLFTIAISDVPGDDPSAIASGPTVPDPTNRHMALDLINRYKLDLPANVIEFLQTPAAETPKPGDLVFARSKFTMASRPEDMINAVADQGRFMGYQVVNLGANVEGEASEVGRDQAFLATQIAAAVSSVSAPVIIVSGGETTVTVGKDGGRGGRNCEFLLSLGIHLRGNPIVSALAIDTDGIDGSEDNAGAFLDPLTIAHASTIGHDPQRYMAKHDSYSFFEANNCLVRTGPTGTNVNDLRIILIDPRTQ
ncbi:hypothetical protein N182_30040 [Sinorhizobium sp. GL2]|nr:hypothetical protein N182_30040 [Sinorhizobium sp. GL2]